MKLEGELKKEQQIGGRREDSHLPARAFSGIKEELHHQQHQQTYATGMLKTPRVVCPGGTHGKQATRPISVTGSTPSVATITERVLKLCQRASVRSFLPLDTRQVETICPGEPGFSVPFYQYTDTAHCRWRATKFNSANTLALLFINTF